jgi:stearoyl-CoA desaturase (Delta-9 desaturase)
MQKQSLHWLNLLFMLTFHLGGVWGIVHLVMQFSWWTTGLALIWFALSGLAITMGYHRYYSHRAFRARGPLQVAFLFFGGAAVQNSVLKWATDHRTHHAKVDTEKDPYNITRGFWWAHIGWILHHSPTDHLPSTHKDLSKDRLVALQDKYYIGLVALASFLGPALIAMAWGDFLGGFLIAGCLRLVLQWHSTFSINSVAHVLGTRPYSLKNTARDSIITALLTFGEGYHNFHHRFQSDYRNGIRWFHFDPTKWAIWSLSLVGLTGNLKRVSREAIRKAKDAVKAEKRQLAAHSRS